MKVARSLSLAALATAALLVFAACAPAAPEEATAVPLVADAATSVTFVAVVDGDTITTSAGAVRIIGIDTPERDQCGYDESSAAIGMLLTPGDAITLELPEGQNDQDSYGRLLRFVTTTDGVDVGLTQLQSGHAVARYDSREGYPAHPREAEYHATQLATRSAEGIVLSVACQAVAAPEPAPAAPVAPVVEPAPEPAPAPLAEDQWWLQYTSCTKLKKNGVGHPTGPFARDNPAETAIYDWFAFGTGNNGDGEGDGLACE